MSVMGTASTTQPAGSAMTTDLPRLSTFHNDDLTFEVIDTGPVDGEVVVLLHGWPETAKCWAGVSARLNAQGYRTLMPNQRGYSPLARPKGIRAYRMSRLVGDILALITTLDRGPVHLVGHDWGAAVAWSLAAGHPESVRTLTTLSVPHPGAFLSAMLSSDQLLRSYYMGLFQLPKLPELLATRYRPVFTKLLTNAGMTADEVQIVYADIVDAGAISTSLNWYRAMFFSAPSELTRKVTVPTMHIWSDGDTALSRRSAELARNFVDAPYQLRIMEGCTHWLPEQAPGPVTDLISESLANNF